MKNNEQKIKVSDEHLREGIFKKVSASQLSFEDNFMNHVPKTEGEKWLMEDVKKVIEVGVRDFWRPVCDPAFNDNGGICYEPGKKPAVGKSFDWWDNKAKEFCPEKGSRLGTRLEYVAFLAVLIKELVATGWKVADAWNAVCNTSNELGHYGNSANARFNLELTGSREICGWCDLANTYKILALEYTHTMDPDLVKSYRIWKNENHMGFWIASGDFLCHSFNIPLSFLRFDCDSFYDAGYSNCGWLVFDSCPDR